MCVCQFTVFIAPILFNQHNCTFRKASSNKQTKTRCCSEIKSISLNNNKTVRALARIWLRHTKKRWMVNSNSDGAAEASIRRGPCERVHVQCRSSIAFESALDEIGFVDVSLAQSAHVVRRKCNLHLVVHVKPFRMVVDFVRIECDAAHEAERLVAVM